MKEKLNTNILVQMYLGNELDANERSEFEHLLRQDKLLVAELKLQLAVDQAIADSSLESLKIYLEKLHNKHLGSKLNNNSLGYNPYLVFVATVLVIVTIGSIFFYNHNIEASLQYFNEYYEPYDLSLVSRNHSKDSMMSLDLIKLIQSNNSKDFVKAGEILIVYDIDAYPNQQLIMMTSIIQLELNNFELAEAEFIKIINDNYALIKQDALWYLGLMYIKTEKLKKAKKILNKIIKENSFYSRRASKLLLKLKWLSLKLL